MEKFKTKILSCLDRNYNLNFNSRKCIKIYFGKPTYDYNDIIVSTSDGKTAYRCLGKGWFKIIK